MPQRKNPQRKKPALPPASVSFQSAISCLRTHHADQCAASSASASCLAIAPLTADCTFSKARTSIWRTRSRDTPNSAARSSRVIGSAPTPRASEMHPSLGLDPPLSPLTAPPPSTTPPFPSHLYLP